LREYARDRSALRRDVKDAFGTTAREAKKLLLSMAFGRSLRKWTSARGMCAKAIPTKLRQFHEELARARVVITAGVQEEGESQLTAMARRVADVESEIMRRIEGTLGESGYEAGTLVHDAIIVQRRDRARCGPDDRERIAAVMSEELQKIKVEKNWELDLRMHIARAGD
jgi:hypothetical protein